MTRSGVMVCRWYHASSSREGAARGEMTRVEDLEFVLNDEQQALRETLRTFVAKEVRPNAGEWDASAEFPRITVEKLGELGLFDNGPRSADARALEASWQVWGPLSVGAR